MKPDRTKRRQRRPALTLRLTGDTRKGHFCVLIAAQPVWLATKRFIALCELVRAKLTEDVGHVRLDPSLVCHLRADIDAAVGGAEDLIRNTLKQRYCLGVSRSHITVSASFRALPQGAFHDELQADISRLVPQRPPRPRKRTE